MITKISNIPTFKNTNVLNGYNAPKTNTLTFDEFIRKPQATETQSNVLKVEQVIPAKDKSYLKPILIAVSAASVIGIGVIAILKNKNNIKDFIEVQKLKKMSNNLAKKYPQDAQYRKRLAQAVGLTDSDSYKLSSIAGAEELRFAMDKLEKTPEVFSPGSSIYDNTGKLIGFNSENVSVFNYGANLHTHTVNSDGKISVKKMLDDASKYADKRMQLRNQPFYLAITDHDGVEGCKEAVEIIKNNPKKFKNLRLLLGMESTMTYKNPEILNGEGQIHILSYGINPYSKEMSDFITTRINKNHQNINAALQQANNMFSTLENGTKINFDLDDFSKITRSIKTGLRNSNFYMKDYLQFKHIFSETVSQNSELIKLLNDSKVDFSKIDYSKPIELIGENLDYSNGQKYYEYYYKALQKHIAKLIKENNPSIAEDEIQGLFPKLSSKLVSKLNEIESLSITKNSKLYVPDVELVDIERGIDVLAGMKDGVLSFAHPGVIFPANSVKDINKLPDLYKKLFEIFKEKGKDKAKYVEGFYQSYYNTPDTPIFKKLIEIGKSMGLKQTGGLDTHSTNIFSK